MIFEPWCECMTTCVGCDSFCFPYVPLLLIAFGVIGVILMLEWIEWRFFKEPKK